MILGSGRIRQRLAGERWLRELGARTSDRRGQSSAADRTGVRGRGESSAADRTGREAGEAYREQQVMASGPVDRRMPDQGSRGIDGRRLQKAVCEKVLSANHTLSAKPVTHRRMANQRQPRQREWEEGVVMEECRGKSSDRRDKG